MLILQYLRAVKDFGPWLVEKGIMNYSSINRVTGRSGLVSVGTLGECLA